MVTSAGPAPTITTFSPLLEVPLTKLTEPTVPAMEAFNVAAFRSACAPLSADSALVIAALSETTRAALDWFVVPVRAPDA